MLIALIATAFLTGNPKSGDVSAKTTLANLEAKAKDEKKNVLVVFHASWCGWCHKLDNFMESPKFKPLFEKNYEVMVVDVQESDKKNLETPDGAEISTKLGADQQGLPFFVAVDPSGKILMDSKAPSAGGKASNIGFPSEPGEVAYFLNFLKKTAPNASSEDLEKVKQFLATPPKS